jgi:GT2 family glycosyltransferase
MVDSIDQPIEKLCIVQNGTDDTVNDAINAISAGRNNLIDKVYIERPFRNMGVAPAWNSIIKSFPECAYWLIANNDTVFLPGDLTKYNDLYHHNANAVIAAANGAFNCFVITPEIVAKVGLFDENIWPIYHEDIDYFVRMQRAGVDRISINSEIGHSNDGSWTIKSNPTYAASNNSTQNSNGKYVDEKWGSSQENANPWNHPSRDCRDWWYNPYRRLQHSTVWNHFEQTANRIR